MVDQANINVSPLELAYVQSPYDYAEIVSIDTSEAIKVPGVVSVITADDIPGDNNTLGMQGACELLAEKFVNYQGQILAVVVAEDFKIANEAVSMIAVEYKPLPPIQGLLDAVNFDSSHHQFKECNSTDNEFNDEGLDFIDTDHWFSENASTLDLGSVTAEPYKEGGVLIRTAYFDVNNITSSLANLLSLKKDEIFIDSPNGDCFPKFTQLIYNQILGIAALGSLITKKKIQVVSRTFFNGIKVLNCGEVKIQSRVGFDGEGKIISFDSNLKLDCGSELGASDCIFSGFFKVLKKLGEGVRLTANFDHCKTNLIPNMATLQEGVWLGLMVLDDVINKIAVKISEPVNEVRKKNMATGKPYRRLEEIYSKRLKEVNAFNDKNESIKKSVYLFNVDLTEKLDDKKGEGINGAAVAEVEVNIISETLKLCYSNFIQEYNWTGLYNQERSISITSFLQGLDRLSVTQTSNSERVRNNLFPDDLFCDVISINDESSTTPRTLSYCLSLCVYFAILEVIRKFDSGLPLNISFDILNTSNNFKQKHQE